MKKLARIPFPIIDGMQTDVRQQFFNGMRKWFNTAGYKENEDYRFEWENTGNWVPDYIWLEEDLAIIFLLRYNCGKPNLTYQ